MGESGSVAQSATTTTPIEYLDQLCDYAMSIGMSYHDYWFSDYTMLIHYHNAEKIRQRKRNNEMWVQGMYIYSAIGNLVPVLNPFSKEHKARPYLKQPIPISQEEKEEQEREKYERFVNYMMSKVKK